MNIISENKFGTQATVETISVTDPNRNRAAGYILGVAGEFVQENLTNHTNAVVVSIRRNEDQITASLHTAAQVTNLEETPWRAGEVMQSAYDVATKNGVAYVNLYDPGLNVGVMLERRPTSLNTTVTAERVKAEVKVDTAVRQVTTILGSHAWNSKPVATETVDFDYEVEYDEPRIDLAVKHNQTLVASLRNVVDELTGRVVGTAAGAADSATDAPNGVDEAIATAVEAAPKKAKK